MTKNSAAHRCTLVLGQPPQPTGLLPPRSSPRLTCCPALAPNSSADKDTLGKAIAQVDLHALTAAQQDSFDASLRTAQSTLRTLNPLLRQANYHLTGNSHIDAAWLWPWTETVDMVQHTFSTALQLMNEYPKYTYTQSAAAVQRMDGARNIPQLNDEITDRVKEGRWEIVGGMWVEPDLNMPDGESQVRQLLVGKRYFQKIYGIRCTHRLEPRLLRLQLAAAADIQALRHRLLCHAEDDVERHQQASVQALLVGVTRWQQGAHLLPSRLREQRRRSRPALK